MDTEIGICRPEELPALIAALDAQFVLGKGRTLSLSARYPAALGEGQADNVHVLRLEGHIAACVAARPFDWVSGAERWRGAMLGMVWTRPDLRGKGYSSQLLAAVATALRESGFDFAVLWTALEGFYEKLGWVRHDRGRLGLVQPPGHDPLLPHSWGRAGTQGDALVPGADRVEKIESLRARCLAQRIARAPIDYRTIPLPADEVHLHTAGAAEDPRGYILYGVRGETVYVYEMAGDTDTFAALWKGATADATRVYVNDAAGSVSFAWLSANAPIQWQPQRLAMWRPLSARAESAPYTAWHIRYFDRI